MVSRFAAALASSKPHGPIWLCRCLFPHRMTSFHFTDDLAASGPAKGAWRPLLRTRLVGRAEPLFVDASGLRSAASIWNGAQAWAQLLRSQAQGARVVVRHTERLALLQLLVAALWDGRTLQVDDASQAPWPGAWCVDGRQVAFDGQPACRLGDGGWPDLNGPARISTLDMLAFAPAHGDLDVRGRQASHGDLWLAVGAPLAAQLADQPTDLPTDQPAAGPAAVLPATRTEVLAPFDLCALATPHDVLNDALVPLLRCTEVWERTALSAD